MKKGYVFLLFLSLSAIVFSPALTSFFYWDDFPLLCMSRYIGNPLSFFTENYFPGGYNYRPLGMLSYWLSYQLFGLSPILHNLLNSVLHVTNAFLCYVFLKELFGTKHFILIFFSSLLFLIHPVAISTSLWLGDRFDLLATMFILSTLFSFLRFVSTHQRKFFFYSLISTFLGILSKEISYILPLLITLTLYLREAMFMNSSKIWTSKS